MNWKSKILFGISIFLISMSFSCNTTCAYETTVSNLLDSIERAFDITQNAEDSTLDSRAAHIYSEIQRFKKDQRKHLSPFMEIYKNEIELGDTLYGSVTLASAIDQSEAKAVLEYKDTVFELVDYHSEYYYYNIEFVPVDTGVNFFETTIRYRGQEYFIGATFVVNERED